MRRRFAARRAQRDLLWRQWLGDVKHSYELVRGTQAQVAFEAARAFGKREGFSPLVILPRLSLRGLDRADEPRGRQSRHGLGVL